MMKTVAACYVPDIERLGDAEALEVMNTVGREEISCANWAADYPYVPSAGVRVVASDKVLSLLYEVEENHVRAVAMEGNGRVWEDSCVEFFVGAPSGDGYFNFEVNCAGTLLASARRSREDAVHFTPEQLARVRVCGSLPHRPVDSRGEGQRWTMLLMVPFDLLGFDHIPETLRANFYKCGDLCDSPHYLSWSPITLPSPDFHCPAFFGEVRCG